jgi:hypothetical protein
MDEILALIENEPGSPASMPVFSEMPDINYH